MISNDACLHKKKIKKNKKKTATKTTITTTITKTPNNLIINRDKSLECTFESCV